MQLAPHFIRKGVAKSILTTTDLLWPLLRLRTAPEILIKTYYPGCLVKIRNSSNSWVIDVTNRDPSKITTEQIEWFFKNLLLDRLPGTPTLKRGLRIDFRIESVCLESWRDICEGRIQQLIDDNHEAFESEKAGAFGYLKGSTKPERLRFTQYAKEYPDNFEYIRLVNIQNMKTYLSLLEYKRKFKSIIDI